MEEYHLPLGGLPSERLPVMPSFGGAKEMSNKGIGRLWIGAWSHRVTGPPGSLYKVSWLFVWGPPAPA
jgi:hypothetical protein